MTLHRLARGAFRTGLVVLLVLGPAGCGVFNGDSGLFKRNRDKAPRVQNDGSQRASATYVEPEARSGTRIQDLFASSADPNTTVDVNKYIWRAAQDVLSFLPIEQVDPFTGVLVTGYGRPPGGGRAYRATVYVQDPALDARSLKVALQAQGGGPVAPDTVRAVEDAILTRARQLRIADGRL